jgi:transcriptional regulator with XRE-family HTH domain
MRNKLIEIRQAQGKSRNDFESISRSKLWKLELGQDDFRISAGTSLANELGVEYDPEGYFTQEGEKTKLSAYIKDHGLLIGDIARETNLNRTAIYYILNGKREPLYSTARKIADYVGIKFDEGGVFVDYPSDAAEEK